MTVSMDDKTAARESSRLRPTARWMLWLAAGIAVQISSVSPTQAQEDATEGQVEVQLEESPTSVLAQFTTGVENREPVDQITFVENGVKTVYFFSDLRGLAGRTVQHRWIYGGETVARLNFEVRGPRWRVWSSKELLPDWIGDWTVEIVVVDSDDSREDGEDGESDAEVDGEVIAAETFTYSAPDA